MKVKVLLATIPLLSGLMFDQSLKYYVATSNLLHWNQGFFLGSFSSWPPSLRIITLSTCTCFLLFFYLLLHYFIRPQAPLLRLGLGLFFSGIIGNTIDRMVYSKVMDFIPLPFTNGIFFNLADAIQWVGVAFISWGIFRYEKELWFPDNNRSKYVISKNFQTLIALKLALVCGLLSLILGVFSYTFIKVYYHPVISYAPLINSFLVSFLSLSLSFSIIVFFVGIFISHRSAGAIYAFENYVEDLLAGRKRTFKLRQSDYHKGLEGIAKRLAESFPSTKDDL